MVVQEISLFYGVPSAIDFTKMQARMPSPENMFSASTADQWRAARIVHEHEMKAVDFDSSSLSLAGLYHLFDRQDFLGQRIIATPLQLRLLLCALQTQVMQFAQLQRFIPATSPIGALAVMKTPRPWSILRLEELETLLMRWRLFHDRVRETYESSNSKDSGCTAELLSCALLYHIIKIELYICFDDVQIVLGKEGFTAGQALLGTLRHWVQSSAARKAVAHAGQVFGILTNSVNAQLLPLWWPVALSRIASVIWAYTVGLHAETGTTAGMPHAFLQSARLICTASLAGSPVADGIIVHPGEGLPCLGQHDGRLVPLHQLDAVLDACVSLLQRESVKILPLSVGVQAFLLDLKHTGNPYSSAA